MLQLNTSILDQVVRQALDAASSHPRWVTAIDRAVAEIDTNPYIEWQDDHLLIGSPSGAVYSSNGVCQCQAFTHGQACWHRAAARLVRRYHEATLRGPHSAPVRNVATTVDTTPAALGQRIGAARAKAQAAIDELFPSRYATDVFALNLPEE